MVRIYACQQKIIFCMLIFLDSTDFRLPVLQKVFLLIGYYERLHRGFFFVFYGFKIKISCLYKYFNCCNKYVETKYEVFIEVHNRAFYSNRLENFEFLYEILILNASYCKMRELDIVQIYYKKVNILKCKSTYRLVIM